MKKKISKVIITLLIGFSFLNVTSNSVTFNEREVSQTTYQQINISKLPDLPTEN